MIDRLSLGSHKNMRRNPINTFMFIHLKVWSLVFTIYLFLNNIFAMNYTFFEPKVEDLHKN